MKWLLIILLTFFAVYMVLAFVIWDITWVVNYEMRFFYTLACVLISLALLVDR